MILGVDEVGRGSIAGPVVSAAVILGENKIFGLKDSKDLSEKKRIEFSNQIQPVYFLKTTDELWPPNPKVLLITAFTFLF